MDPATLTPERLAADYMVLLISFLSLIASIPWYIIYFHSIDYFRKRSDGILFAFVACMTLANSIASIGHSPIRFIIKDSCMVQGLMKQFGLTLSIWSRISIQIICNKPLHTRLKLYYLNPTLHKAVFLSIMAAALPYSTESYEETSFGWCWVSGNGVINIVWRLGLLYFPAYLSWIIYLLSPQYKKNSTEYYAQYLQLSHILYILPSLVRIAEAFQMDLNQLNVLFTIPILSSISQRWLITGSTLSLTSIPWMDCILIIYIVYKKIKTKTLISDRNEIASTNNSQISIFVCSSFVCPYETNTQQQQVTFNDNNTVINEPQGEISYFPNFNNEKRIIHVPQQYVTPIISDNSLYCEEDSSDSMQDDHYSCDGLQSDWDAYGSEYKYDDQDEEFQYMSLKIIKGFCNEIEIKSNKNIPNTIYELFVMFIGGKIELMLIDIVINELKKHKIDTVEIIEMNHYVKELQKHNEYNILYYEEAAILFISVYYNILQYNGVGTTNHNQLKKCGLFMGILHRAFNKINQRLNVTQLDNKYFYPLEFIEGKTEYASTKFDVYSYWKNDPINDENKQYVLLQVRNINDKLMRGTIKCVVIDWSLKPYRNNDNNQNIDPIFFTPDNDTPVTFYGCIFAPFDIPTRQIIAKAVNAL